MEFIIPFTLFLFGSLIFYFKNPVYGVLSFVVVIFHVVFILIVIDLEFFAYVLAIVYIGAIVVLFLFVIMMFQIKENKNSNIFIFGAVEYFILGVFVAYFFNIYTQFSLQTYVDYANVISVINSQNIIAFILFNDWAILTILAAILMFISIIAAILLTKNDTMNPVFHRTRTRVQDAIKKKCF